MMRNLIHLRPSTRLPSFVLHQYELDSNGSHDSYFVNGHFQCSSVLWQFYSLELSCNHTIDYLINILMGDCNAYLFSRKYFTNHIF